LQQPHFESHLYLSCPWWAEGPRSGVDPLGDHALETPEIAVVGCGKALGSVMRNFEGPGILRSARARQAGFVSQAVFSSSKFVACPAINPRLPSAGSVAPSQFTLNRSRVPPSRATNS
jgi:hypothetical protein